MGVAFDQLYHDRTEGIGREDTATIPYLATTDAGESESAVLLAASVLIPAIYDGRLRSSIVLTEQLTPTQWRLAVRYDLYESSWSFDTSGGTEHISHSLETIAAYGPAASDQLAGAINYDGRQIHGLDVARPQYGFSETHYLSDFVITPAYKATVSLLTRSVNRFPWRGFNAGEVLFMGAQGGKRGSELWEVQYRFLANPNQTNLGIGDITGINKKGWEYLWIQCEDDVDEEADAPCMIRVPSAVYVERVFALADFALLGLGV